MPQAGKVAKVDATLTVDTGTAWRTSRSAGLGRHAQRRRDELYVLDLDPDAPAVVVVDLDGTCGRARHPAVTVAVAGAPGSRVLARDPVGNTSPC